MLQQLTPAIFLKCLPLLKEQTEVLTECGVNLYSHLHLFHQGLLSTSFVLSTILSTEGVQEKRV